MRKKTLPARSSREIEVKGKMEKRTERDSDRRRRKVADLLVLPRPAKSVQNDAGWSEKLEHTGPAENERVTSVPERSWQVRQSSLCQK